MHLHFLTRLHLVVSILAIGVHAQRRCGNGYYPTPRYTGAYGSICIPCPASQARYAATQDDCTRCAVGTYSAEVGQTRCDNCPAGKYQGEKGGTLCWPCPPDEVSLAGQGSCAPFDCGDGYVRDKQWRADFGIWFCDQCIAGKYRDTSRHPDRDYCTRCDVGKYQDKKRRTSCKTCSEGKYSATTGSAECSTCPENSLSLSAGSDSRSDCKCLSGYTADSDGEACEPCSYGRYKPETGIGECTVCSIGTHQDEKGQTSCEECAVGKYGDTNGNRHCSECPQNSRSLSAGSVAVTDCKCLTGYTADSDGEACSACPNGEYKSVTGTSTCSLCPAGTSSEQGSSALVDCMCLAGYGGTSHGAVCEVCGEDTYKVGVGIGACTSCPVNSYSDSGSGRFDDCRCKTLEEMNDARECSQTQCRPGQYASSTETVEGVDVVTCTACAKGGFQPSANFATGCPLCLPGTYSEGTGARICEPCKPGTYAGGFESTSCNPCGGGTYQDAWAASSCSRCFPGASSDGGSDASADCECLESHTLIPDGTACISCARGTYMSAEGVGECLACPDGMTSDLGSVAQADCRCLVGLKGLVDEDLVCLLCDPGKKQVAGDCLECSTGFSSNDRRRCGRSVDCVSQCPNSQVEVASCGYNQDRVCGCGPGQHVVGITCADCDAGTYSPLPDRTTACVPCPAHTVSQAAATSCDACGSGTDAAGTGNRECTPCALGTFTRAGGTGECATFQAACGLVAGPDYDQCDGAYFNCAPCEAGRYKETGQTPDDCRSCPAGMVFTDGSQTPTSSGCECSSILQRGAASVRGATSKRFLEILEDNAAVMRAAYLFSGPP